MKSVAELLLARSRLVGKEQKKPRLSICCTHANLRDLWSNVVAESCEPVNPRCRRVVGGRDLGAECVKMRPLSFCVL